VEHEVSRPVALLVNDEPELNDKIKKNLEALDFDVQVTVDALHVAQQMRRRLPAFVCVNLNLPRGSGYEVCQLIRRNPALREVPILVMSERHLPEDIAFAEEAGASVFLARPFQTANFNDDFREQVLAMIEHERPSFPGAVELAGAAEREERPE
jgi:DNA-binding response OmpR family regulator